MTREQAFTAPLAQLAARWSHNPEVVSSILTGSTFTLFECALFHAGGTSRRVATDSDKKVQ